MVRPSGDHIGWRASLKTSVMRVIVPPVAGSVQMLPCMSVAMVLPSGEMATDIDVPSCTVTSMVLGGGGVAGLRTGAGVGREPCCAPTTDTIPTSAITTSGVFMPRILLADRGSVIGDSGSGIRRLGAAGDGGRPVPARHDR